MFQHIHIMNLVLRETIKIKLRECKNMNLIYGNYEPYNYCPIKKFMFNFSVNNEVLKLLLFDKTIICKNPLGIFFSY